MLPATPPNMPSILLPPSIVPPQQPRVDEGIVDLLFSKIDLNFKFLDEELMKRNIPKDLTELIFSYAIPYCPDCAKCCGLCKYICSSSEDCIRLNGLETCAKYEYNALLKKYE